MPCRALALLPLLAVPLAPAFPAPPPANAGTAVYTSISALDDFFDAEVTRVPLGTTVSTVTSTGPREVPRAAV